MEKDVIKKKLLAAGVNNLKEFGHSCVTSKNILTDMIYSAFFKSMLNDNKGNGATIDTAINELLTQIKQNNETH